MAQETPIVIFPSLRRSDLEREVRTRRDALKASVADLETAARKSVRPFSFIQHHPKLLLGLIFTAFSGSKLVFGAVRGLMGLKKKNILWKIVKAGWFWNMARLVFKYVLHKKKDTLAKTGLTVLKNFVFSRRFK